MQGVPDPLVVLDAECRVSLAHEAFYALMAEDHEQIQGKACLGNRHLWTSRCSALAIDDVTDSRQPEALRIDADTLRLVDKRKDEFLGVLAHELRNPLAPMQ